MDNILKKRYNILLYAVIFGTIIGIISLKNDIAFVISGVIFFIFLFVVILKTEFTNKVVIVIYISIFQPYFVIANKNMTITLILVPLIFIIDLFNRKITIGFKENKQALFFIIYIISVILSIYNCININAAYIWILLWSYYFILYIWISFNKDNIEINKIYNAVFNCGIIVGIIGIAQFVAFNFLNLFGRFSNALINSSLLKLVYGNLSELIGTTSASWTKGGFVRATTLFPSPDSSGLFSLMIMIICIGYFNKEKNIKSKLCFILITSSFILSLSRASWAAFLVVIVVLLIFYKGNRLKRFVQLLTVILLIIIVMMLLNKLDMFLNIFYSIFDTTTDISNLGRIQIWKQNIQLFVMHKFIGGGIGNYNDIYMNYFNLGEANVKYSAHSAYFAVLVEQGILGFFGFIAILSMPIIEIFSSKVREINGLKKHYILSICYISIAIMTQYIFDYSLGEIRYMNLIFICFAIAYNIKVNYIKN